MFRSGSMYVPLVLFLLAAVAAPCSAQSLMRRESGRKGTSALQAALQELLGAVPAERLFAVEASVRPAYEAFPKNSLGQLPPKDIFAALVRGYFSKEHGWVLTGLEPPGMARTVTSVPQAAVLLRRAPRLARELKTLLHADRGLSLSDVVGTIAALEHLLLDETNAELRDAYYLTDQTADEAVEEETFDEVLYSFLLLHRHGGPWNLTDAGMFQRMKARAAQAEDWKELVKFEAEAVALEGAAGKRDFEEASRIAKGMTLRFGRWQNSECLQMKADLMTIGSKASGRVPLAVFHAEKPHASYQFTESADFLQQAGMLDESANGTKEVLIANYLLGRSNCIAPSEFYSVCCLSECEALMSELEQRIAAPQWPPQRLADLVSQVPSSTVAAPRELPASLSEALVTIAARHGGAVPLHSADFLHFLHQAYPNECPLPTPTESLAEESERTSTEQWLAAQEECTRIPEWHPAKWGEEALMNI